MSTFTPAQIYGGIHAETLKNGGHASRAQEIVFTAIVLAESGGDPSALHVNTGGSAPGSHDRGLFQFNDHFNPDISDSDAFNPATATHWAYVKSDGWKNTQPWTGDKGLLQSQSQTTTMVVNGANVPSFYSQALHGAIAYVAANAGNVVTGTDAATVDPFNTLDLQGTGSVVSDTAATAVSTISDWTSSLSGLLSKIMSGTFWKRIGIGALGLLIIIFAFVAIFGHDATNIVESVKP